MRRLLRINDRITVGPVPSPEDIATLGALDFRTIVDVRRGADIKKGGLHLAASIEGLRYVRSPMGTGDIELDDVIAFFLSVYEREGSPVYAFSDSGRRPLAFLLLLETVMGEKPIDRVFHGAQALGVRLEDDLQLCHFLLEFSRRSELMDAVETLAQLRPELARALMTPIDSVVEPELLFAPAA